MKREILTFCTLKMNNPKILPAETAGTVVVKVACHELSNGATKELVVAPESVRARTEEIMGFVWNLNDE